MNWDPTSHYKAVAVAREYDRIRFSSLAGRTFNALEKQQIRRIFADIPKESRILDMPCGTGRFAEVLLEMGYHVTGVDISEAMLEVAREKLAPFGNALTTRTIDVRELAKTEQKSFDITLCARFLMHFPLDRQIEFMRSIASLTRHTVIFTQSFSSPYQRMRRRAKGLIGKALPSSHPITEIELKKLLQGAGLREIKRIRPMPLLTEVIYVICEPIR
jgi:2-polyprenyl-3-methyl-5-hydroxy-6-metoxy-1,4-benzoquinol methylase